MSVVKVLEQSETACVDADRLNALYRGLGPVAADDLVARAVEELAVALSYADELYQHARFDQLRATIVEIGHISDQIGLTGMSLVAGHVVRSIEATDGNALAATLSRLLRVGERSLTAVWDVQDQSC